MASGYFCLIARCCCIIGVSVLAFAIREGTNIMALGAMRRISRGSCGEIGGYCIDMYLVPYILKIV